jgi:hypothetical protein
MPETIKAGTILIKQGTLMPDTLRLESEPYAPGWRMLKDLDGRALERRAHEAGWAFFYLAGEHRVTVLGGEGQETLRRALKRILDGQESEKPNTIEITRVVSKTFLGLHYDTVIFHQRNMQKSMFLFAGDDSNALDDSHAKKDAVLLAA